jgi:phosphoglycerol transferase
VDLPAAVREAAAYATAVVLCSLALAWTLKLWRADLHVPFAYTGDTLVWHAWIKGTIESGWYLENDRLGAPHGQENYDFPMADGLHFALLKLLSLFVGDWGFVFNAYYLLTFPLTAVCALGAMRALGICRAVAVVLSVLFAFLPFHFLRLAHLFLASYYLVPLATLVVVRTYTDFVPRRPGPDQGPGGGPSALPRLSHVVTFLLVGSAGVYYAFFACYFLLVAGVVAACHCRRLAPCWRAGALLACVAVAAAVNLSPSVAFRLSRGPNPDAVLRGAWEAEVYGLKMTQLLLPMTNHRSPVLAGLKQRYNSPCTPLVNENDTASLGAVGAVGLVLLLLGVFLRRRPAGSPAFRALSLLVLAALLLGTVGGLGSFFSLLVAPYIRAYNRVSVYIAFFALLGLALTLDRAAAFCAGSVPRRGCFLGSLLLLLAAGLYDQTSPSFVPEYARWRTQFGKDRSFVERLEGRLPAGAMVFQLPYLPYPEAAPLHGMQDYDPLRLYLHSRSLRWSYGSMKGRGADDWHRAVAGMSVGLQLDRLVMAGFQGITVDRAGYPDRAAAVEAELARALGGPDLTSPDNRFSFFSLVPRQQALRLPKGAAERHRAAVGHPVTCELRGGFCEWEYPDAASRFRWCSGRGEVVVHNPLPFPRKMTLDLAADTLGAGAWQLRLDSAFYTTSLPLGARGLTVSTEVLVPPGDHTLTLTSARPRIPSGRDPRRLVFRVFHCVLSDAN